MSGDLVFENLDQVPTLADPVSSVGSFNASSIAGLALLGVGVGFGVKKVFFDSKKNEKEIKKKKFSCTSGKCKRNV
jgi:hypothetical protein